METLVERGCGLDVHQATVVACLLVVRKDGKVQKQLRTFGTTTRELLSLRQWLVSEGCTHVAMESTGIYWKPIYAVLEGDELEIIVANAQRDIGLEELAEITGVSTLSLFAAFKKYRGYTPLEFVALARSRREKMQ